MITEFKGDYAFLSNFWQGLSPVWWEGQDWPTAEHAFQAAKTDHAGARELIRMAMTPAEAKRIGQRVPLDPWWNRKRVPVMLSILVAKFYLASDLAAALDATSDQELIEGNYWHDNFWGNCLCNNCIDKRDVNMLGQLLMIVREVNRAS